MTRFFNLDLGEAKKITNEQAIKNIETLKGLNAKFYIKKGVFNYSINGSNKKSLKTIKDPKKVYDAIDKF